MQAGNWHLFTLGKSGAELALRALQNARRNASCSLLEKTKKYIYILKKYINPSSRFFTTFAQGRK